MLRQQLHRVRSIRSRSESHISINIKSAGHSISDFKGGNAWLKLSAFKPEAGKNMQITMYISS